MLPSVKDCDGTTLVGALAGSDDEYLKIFDTMPIKLLLKFKWTRFSRHMHSFGSALHAVYVITLLHYISLTFLDREPYDPLADDWKDLPDEVKYYGMTAK